MSSAISASKQVCYRIPDHRFFQKESLLRIFFSYLPRIEIPDGERIACLKGLLDPDACKEIEGAPETGAQRCSELAARELFGWYYPDVPFDKEKSATLQYQAQCQRTLTDMRQGTYSFRKLTDHVYGVNCLSLTEDGFASGSDDTTIILYDRQGERVRTLAGNVGHRGTVLFLAPTANGLVSADSLGAMKFWNLHKNELTRTVEVRNGIIHCLTAIEGGVAVGNSNGNVDMFDLQGTHIKTITGHTYTVGDVIRTESGGASLAGRTIRLWNPEFEDKYTEITLEFNGSQRAVSCFQKIKRRLVLGFENGNIVFRDLSGSLIKTLAQRHTKAVTCLTHMELMEGEGCIVSGSDDGFICLWDLQGDAIGMFPGDKTRITSLVPLPCGFAAASGRSIKLWDFSKQITARWLELREGFSTATRGTEHFTTLVRRVNGLSDRHGVFSVLAQCMIDEAIADGNSWKDAYDGCGEDAFYGIKRSDASRKATPKQISQAITAYLYKTAKAASQQPENKDSKDNKQG